MKKSVFTLMIAGAVFIGYLSGCKRNEMPVIESLIPENSEDTLVVAGDTVKVICTATDADENELFYTWDASGGGFTESEDGTEITWVAPNQSGVYNIVCKVTDLEEDTVNFVSDTFSVDVQNYFPMAQGNWWHYEGIIWWVLQSEIDRTVFSYENLSDGKTRWHLETKYPTQTGDRVDSVNYYAVKGGSVWELNDFFGLDSKPEEKLICEMPLWENKTWDYDTASEATVIEIKDRGYTDCAHIEIVISGDTGRVRTIWLAPDVGIIEDKLEINEGVFYDFELMDFDLN